MSIWTDHVKAFAKSKGISYKDALKNPETSKSYKELKGKGLIEDLRESALTGISNDDLARRNELIILAEASRRAEDRETKLLENNANPLLSPRPTKKGGKKALTGKGIEMDTHTHPDGTVMTGKKHTKSSKIIKKGKGIEMEKPERPISRVPSLKSPKKKEGTGEAKRRLLAFESLPEIEEMIRKQEEESTIKSEARLKGTGQGSSRVQPETPTQRLSRESEERQAVLLRQVERIDALNAVRLRRAAEARIRRAEERAERARLQRSNSETSTIDSSDEESSDEQNIVLTPTQVRQRGFRRSTGSVSPSGTGLNVVNMEGHIYPISHESILKMLSIT